MGWGERGTVVLTLSAWETLSCLHTSLDTPPPHPLQARTSIYLFLFAVIPSCLLSACSLGQWLQVPWWLCNHWGSGLASHISVVLPLLYRHAASETSSVWCFPEVNPPKGWQKCHPLWQCFIPTICHHESSCLTEDPVFLWPAPPQSTTGSYLNCSQQRPPWHVFGGPDRAHRDVKNNSVDGKSLVPMSVLLKARKNEQGSFVHMVMESWVFGT